MVPQTAPNRNATLQSIGSFLIPIPRCLPTNLGYRTSLLSHIYRFDDCQYSGKRRGTVRDSSAPSVQERLLSTSPLQGLSEMPTSQLTTLLSFKLSRVSGERSVSRSLAFHKRALISSVADSSALTLNNLKVFIFAFASRRILIIGGQSRYSTNYWSLLEYMFDPTDGANAAGLNYIRVPVGASDFSASGMYNAPVLHSYTMPTCP